MSASASKKKRKELEEQGLSAKSVAAKQAKEQKNKLLKNVLLVALVVIVCAAAVYGVIKLVNRPSYDTSAAVATVGNEKITVPVYDYFYNQTANDFYNRFSFMVEAGTPLSLQNFGEGSMEDYLKDSTKSGLREVFNIYALAKQAGYELTDEQESIISENLDALEEAVPNVNQYLREVYGEGFDKDVYEECMRIALMYTGYQQQLQDEFKPTAEELQAHYDEDPSAYDIVSFTYATVAAESTTVETPEDNEEEDAASTEPTDADAAEAETEDETEAETAETAAPTEPTQPTTPPTVYTDESKAAAREQAEAYTEQMPENASTFRYNQPTVTSYLTEDIAKWLFDSERKEGDVQVFARDEQETFFYTVRFDGRDVNDYHQINANVISINKDAEGAEIHEGEQTAEEKQKALLDAVKEGMTDEEFTNAVTELKYAANTISVSRNDSIQEICDWLYEDGRKNGDIFTYENDTAYFLVRYVSEDEETYRDKLITDALWTKRYQELSTANEITIDEELLNYAYTDLVFRSSTGES